MERIIGMAGRTNVSGQIVTVAHFTRDGEHRTLTTNVATGRSQELQWRKAEHAARHMTRALAAIRTGGE